MATKAKNGPPVNIPFFIPGTETIDNAWIQWFNDVDLVTGGIAGLGGLADVDGSDAATGDTGLTGGLASLSVDIDGLTNETIADNDELMFADTSDSGNLKKATAAAIAALGKGVLQIAHVEDSTSKTITDIIPADDTTPQIDEGEEIISINFTPKSDYSTLIFICTTWVYASSGDGGVISLFEGNESDAVTTTVSPGSSARFSPVTLMHTTPSSQANGGQAYSVRAGPNGGIGTQLGVLKIYNADRFGENLHTHFWIIEFEDTPAVADGTVSIEASTNTIDESSVINALSGATLTAFDPATDDKILAQDTSSENDLGYFTVQDVIDMVPSSSDSGGGSVTEEDVEDIVGGMVTGNTETGIAVSYDDSDGTLDFTVDHNTANNYVSNEHVNHTTVDITAGDGLSGGGDLTATRTLNVDINGATDLTSPAVADELLLSDADDSNSIKKADLASIVNLADHDALTNFVANEHIDWTSTSSAFSTSGTAATGNLTVTGTISVTSTVDGRDVATDGTKLDGIEASADVTDEANVTAALDGATISTATVATDDKVLIQDTNDSDNLKTVTAQAIADLGGGKTDEEIQDLVGAMVTGNTETGISVTYQDADGTLDFDVDFNTLSTATPASGDKFPFVDISDTNIAKQNTLATIMDEGTPHLDITGQTDLTSSISGSDEVLVADASDSNNIKKVTAQSLADLAVGGTAAPGGDSGDLQYNNGGSLGGFGDWDGSSMTVPGNIVLEASGDPVVVAARTSTTVSSGDDMAEWYCYAPNEASGGDANLISARIRMEAQQDFTSTVNETDIIFLTATSGAAAERARITQNGIKVAASHSFQIGSTVAATDILDEDNMASDSATALATQQSIKAYADDIEQIVTQRSWFGV